jgi:glycosyltransferase involved in cell wall biosynthesis
MPHYFPPGQFGFTQWLQSLIATADSAICISHTVAKELQNWVTDFGPQRDQAIGIDWFHLGADLVNSIPSTGLAPDSAKILTTLRTATSFLMVGTIEPRKGHLQTLQAFTQIWQSGLNINLVIVGREGWVGLPDNQRQNVSEIVSLIQSHPELGKRLLWLTEVSDEYLSQIYANSDCLIAASEGEGFGLPLIEAAQHALPIIARDIPVFKEVASDYAYYFNGLEAQDLTYALQDWLVLESEKKQPLSHSMPFLTWAQSTKRVIELLQLALNYESPSPGGKIKS